MASDTESAPVAKDKTVRKTIMFSFLNFWIFRRFSFFSALSCGDYFHFVLFDVIFNVRLISFTFIV